MSRHVPKHRTFYYRLVSSYYTGDSASNDDDDDDGVGDAKVGATSVLRRRKFRKGGRGKLRQKKGEERERDRERKERRETSRAGCLLSLPLRPPPLSLVWKFETLLRDYTLLLFGRSSFLPSFRLARLPTSAKETKFIRFEASRVSLSLSCEPLAASRAPSRRPRKKVFEKL